MPTREQSQQLLERNIQNKALQNHCQMVAAAMEAYAKFLSLPQNEVEEWWAAGLLHDLDWESHPDEHPKYALTNLLGEYPQSVRDAIAAHAPERTGKIANSLIEKYLFACDELSGFIHASALVRPERYQGMEAKSVMKKLKDKKFAANVSREDIRLGSELIGRELEAHIQFLINIFTKQ